MSLPDRFKLPERYAQNSLAALEAALYSAPAYRGWQPLDPGPEASLDARYDALPELTKQMIRDGFPTGLAPAGRDIQAGLLSEEIEYTYTSGSTGDRVINIWDQAWWDRSEAASWQLNAHLARLPYPVREAKLASSLNVGISCEEDLPYASRIVGHRLYLNEKINLIQWQPRHLRRMAEELADFQPVILEANPSLLARLAYWALDNGVGMYQPAVIVFTYEFTSAIHAAAIASVFSAPQVSSFGTTETGFVLEQCECGLLHQNIDFCRIDFEPLREEFGGPELGRMLVSTFSNPWNCVLRFDVGDLVRLHPEGRCACGRDEGLIGEAIEGRATNSTFTTDGRLVTTLRLDQALAGIDGLRDYHMEQDGPGDYRLELMAAGDAAPVAERALDALRALYGAGGRFDVQVLDNILPGPAGKFRRTQANFDFDVRGMFA